MSPQTVRLVRHAPSLHAFIDALHRYYELLRLPVCLQASSGFTHCYALPDASGAYRLSLVSLMHLCQARPALRLRQDLPHLAFCDVFVLPAAAWTASALARWFHEAQSHGSLALRPTLKSNVAASTLRNWIMAGG